MMRHRESRLAAAGAGKIFQRVLEIDGIVALDRTLGRKATVSFTVLPCRSWARNRHMEPAVSPCGGCFSPRTASPLPPNGRQKKSPRSGTSTGAPSLRFSPCHGLM
jgi:hypothetical protein